MSKYGIDLGSAYSRIATKTWQNGREEVQLLKNRQGHDLTPSWVTWRKDKQSWFVGDPAKISCTQTPDCTVYSFKRLMGRNFSDPDVQEAIKSLPYKVKEAAAGGKDLLIEIDGKDYEPQDIGALVLGKMKDDYEYLNPNMKMEEVVITVPAYFNQSQHIATMEAGARAGLTVLALLPEPCAAALAYGIDPDRHDGRTILVYDLGGGVFNVAIIMIDEVGNFITLGLSGDMWLGGNDFDQCLISFIVDHIKKTHKKDPSTEASWMMEITKLAERAKMRLSFEDEVEIQEVLYDREMGNLLIEMKIERRPKCSQCGGRCTVSAKDTVKRDKNGHSIYQAVAVCPKCGAELQGEVVEKTFEGAIMPLVQRTMDLMDKAFANAGLTDDDIDEVLMVGGSTYVPLVREKVRERFGPEKVRFDQDPMLCVAQGAAIYAAKCGLGRDVIAGVTAQSYGIGLAGGKYSIIIPAGTHYPMEEGHTEVFRTENDDQRVFHFPIYCGENTEDVNQNDLMGYVLVMFDKPQPRDTDIYVTFAFDSKHILNVTAENRNDRNGRQPVACFIGSHEYFSVKQILGQVMEIKNQEGTCLSSEQQDALLRLETQAVTLAADRTLSLSNKRAEMAALEKELQELVKELESEISCR
ncbi:MAG TPA: Hsp70 family protein [Candidatus Hydrogenedentes bacterium]|nr:Hsp70 family protein [Candidatus Hydrogenedentota bacterium]